MFNTCRDNKRNPKLRPHESQEKSKNKHWRSNSDRRVKHTAERFNTCQTHQRVDVLNTDHKDVAVFRLQVSRGEHHGVFPFGKQNTGWLVRRIFLLDCSMWNTLVSDVNFRFRLSLVRHKSPRTGSTLMIIFAWNLPSILQTNFGWWTW